MLTPNSAEFRPRQSNEIEKHLHELCRLAGIKMDQAIVGEIISLFRCGVKPNALFKVLKSLADPKKMKMKLRETSTNITSVDTPMPTIKFQLGGSGDARKPSCTPVLPKKVDVLPVNITDDTEDRK